MGAGRSDLRLRIKVYKIDSFGFGKVEEGLEFFNGVKVFKDFENGRLWEYKTAAPARGSALDVY